MRGIVISLLMYFILGGSGYVYASLFDKPYEIIVGWPVGSSSDIMVRAIAPELEKQFNGRKVIVINKPGAGGALGISDVKRVKPDGFTLFQTGTNVFAQLPWTREVPFHPINDFTYVAQHVSSRHYLISRKEMPWNDFNELVAYVKQNPNKVRYATTGTGSTQHVMMEYIAKKEGLSWTHVPYNSGAEAYMAVIGSGVHLAAITIGPEVQYVKAGMAIPLIYFNMKKSPYFEIPTIGDKGYKFECSSSAVWAVPKQTPTVKVRILESALLSAFSKAIVQDVFTRVNFLYDPAGSFEVNNRIAKEYKEFGEIMKECKLGIFSE